MPDGTRLSACEDRVRLAVALSAARIGSSSDSDSAFLPVVSGWDLELALRCLVLRSGRGLETAAPRVRRNFLDEGGWLIGMAAEFARLRPGTSLFETTSGAQTA